MTRPGASQFQRRHYAYALCTEAEYAVVTQQAKLAGLSVSDYVRRCINGALLDAGDDVPLLDERRPRDGR